ncbi:hypothetical protein ACI2JA_19980 [Alkalihalobacillus sp. NPDC078783]
MDIVTFTLTAHMIMLTVITLTLTVDMVMLTMITFLQLNHPYNRFITLLLKYSMKIMFGMSGCIKVIMIKWFFHQKTIKTFLCCSHLQTQKAE